MNSEQQKIIEKTAEEVKRRFEGEGSGHDWSHIFRVWNMAKQICADEKADKFTVELAAILHDIADWKFHNGDETAGPKAAREILQKYSVQKDIISQVCDIIANISFKGAVVKNEIKTLEGKIVQDADRLEAIGAIGIARAFAYGGHKNRPIYEPDKKPVAHQSKESYFKNESSTINHFYEKLLLLKYRMNTETGKKMAEGRHRFMEQYLEKFLQEWDGKN